MESIGLVILDNDGVVVDSEPLANGVLSGVLSEYGHPTTIEQSVRDYLGGTLARVRSIVKQRSGQDLPVDFEDRYHEHLFAAFSAGLRPVPGVEAVLGSLKMPFCLASSGTTDRIVRSLTITGLRHYFGDRIFSAEQVPHGKPAPDLFLYAAAAMGVPVSQCVVVEDSPNGVTAARAAGMTVIGYAALTPAEMLKGVYATFTRMELLLPLLEELRE